jgi:hypothetical protein
MKIISPFNDYYDSVVKQYREGSEVVYKRTPLEFKKNKLKEINQPLITELWNLYNPLITYNDYDFFHLKRSIPQFGKLNLSRAPKYVSNPPYYINAKFTFEYELMLVIFCGKIYRCVEVRSNFITDMEPYSRHHIYNFDEFDKCLSDRDISYANSVSKNSIQRYFDSNSINHETDFLIKNKITIGAITSSHINLNCKLSTYEFYKVFDPFLTYQELDMWLGGTLSYPQNVMIEVSNENKIEKAGFDKRYSFRHRPKS